MDDSLENMKQAYEQVCLEKEQVDRENAVMREALISICHLYKIDAVDSSPYIAREALLSV